MISLDTETTGVDFYHGARPFFVTTCDEAGELKYWEWDVDPFTREPCVPPEDLDEIRETVEAADAIVLQNTKFDARALASVGLRAFPWGKVYDTLLAAHLLESNRPKDLTSLALRWLGANILPQEDRLEEAVKKARNLCRTKAFQEKYGEWAIAEEGRPDMPSAGEKTWKFDTWLPKAIFDRCEEYRELHPTWEHVLSDYANADSPVTLAVWNVQRAEINRRKLMKIYRARLPLLRVAFQMEEQGVTVNEAHVEEMSERLAKDRDEAATVCVNIASTFEYDGQPYKLEPPKAGRSKNLDTFMLDVMKLPPQHTNRHAKTDRPSLDKGAMKFYAETLPPRSRELRFVESLLTKRARDTALQYIEGYKRFWVGLPDVPGWFVLRPDLNPTGSDTLRWTCRNPNEQNISKKTEKCRACGGKGETKGAKCEPCKGTGEISLSLRYCFGPAPGREWWSMDAKNIELRLPFYESGERELIDLFEREHEPPYYGSVHLLNFHTVFPEIWEKELREVGFEKVGPHCKKKYAADYYQRTKNGGFCKQYGGQKKLTDATFGRAGAYDLIEGRFTRLAEHNAKCIRFAEKNGYIETIPDRSVDPERGYPLLCTRTDYGSILPTVPLNYRTQGSAMWWTCKAMVRCQEKLDDWAGAGFTGRIVMQVHDEIVFDFPKSRVHPREDFEKEKAGTKGFTFNDKRSNLWRIRQLQKLMEKGGEDFGIPTPVGVEYHDDNWGEGVTL